MKKLIKKNQAFTDLVGGLFKSNLYKCTESELYYEKPSGDNCFTRVVFNNETKTYKFFGA